MSLNFSLHAIALLSLPLLAALAPPRAGAATYYVRQTVGDDARDGLSPATAWQHIGKLSGAMHAGDTAYVGPGLYRDQITVENDGSANARITFIADPSGQRTGDPPGVVMVTGAEPVDESVFAPGPAPGVYVASFPANTVWGVVEMDGPQHRFARADATAEHLVDKLSEAEVVAKLPATFSYDEHTGALAIHTSDGRPPTAHELELIQRGDGVFILGKHFVTVIGFTFRNMQDAGISFFKGSGDGIAANNVSWGSRQGIRVYGAPNVLVYGNTLFRNENCGVYFAAESTEGKALGNVTYENVKGLRWSSDSANGLALDNWAFDDQENGIAVENANHVVLQRNALVNNAVSQLLVIQSAYESDDNCFQNAGAEQLAADFSPYPLTDRFRTLAEYRAKKHQDLASREGGCDAPPAKVDVQRLHAESMAYAERARRVLRGEPVEETGGGTLRSWLDRLFGRPHPTD